MRWSATAPCILAAALAGCGGGEKAARTLTVGPDEPVRVTADEYSFDPARIVVRGAPRELRVTLSNRGSLAHDIVVLDGRRRLGGVPSFPGGERRSTHLRLPPGSYRFVCTVGDHEQLGMKGRLEVRR